MPRKVTKTITEFDETPDGEEPGVVPGSFDVDTPDESEALQEARQKFGPAEVKFKVYKQEGGKGSAYCFTAQDDIDETYIQENYGGGKYYVKVFVNNRYAEKHELLIAEKKMAGNPSMMDPNLQPRLDPNNIEARMLREQMVFMQNMLLERAKNPSQTPVGEMVEAAKAIASMGTAHKEDDGFDKMARMFEFFKSMSGGGGERSWQSELISTGKEVAAPILREIIAKQMSGNSVPAPAPNPQMQVVPSGGETMIPPDTAIRQGIEFLKSRAMSGMDPELAVDWIVNNATDPMYQSFISNILSQPFESMQKLDVSLTQVPYEPWFRALYNGLKEAFSNEQSTPMAGDTERSTGNVTDITDNARAGKGSVGKPRTA